MREEDIDWKIYHIIAADESTTLTDICTHSGYECDIVRASLERLENNHLIGCDGEMVKLLSIQESILRCQMKQQLKDSPVYFENGVIKVKKEYQENK